jgi:nitrate reductase alpha subunit
VELSINNYSRLVFSYAAGSRFLQLFGGVNMSLYDWYADLTTAFPEVWGDQTDVCESADWYNSKLIVSMASNLNMTRTQDVHFIAGRAPRGQVRDHRRLPYQLHGPMLKMLTCIEAALG